MVLRWDGSWLLEKRRCIQELVQRMSCSSGTDNGWEGRCLNAYCKCGKQAGILISEFDDNKHKLYYYCQQNVCSSFLGWCKPADTFISTSTKETINSKPYYRARLADINGLRDEVLCLQIENRKVYRKIEGLDTTLGFLKMLIALCLICTLFLIILVVMLVGKTA